MANPETILRALLDAYAARDEPAMRAAVADDVRAWITNAEGGVDPLDGSDRFVAALPAYSAEFWS